MRIWKGITCMMWATAIAKDIVTGFTTIEDNPQGFIADAMFTPGIMDNSISSPKENFDVEGLLTTSDSKENFSRNLVGSSDVHSGIYFNDAFYDNECYKISRYDPHPICVMWKGEWMYMARMGEYDMDKQGAKSVKWLNTEVKLLLDWQVATMYWDGGNSDQQKTRLLDTSNIRVLSQPGFYYIKRVVTTKSPQYVMNTNFAKFSLSEGGFNYPPFVMCPHGGSPHVQSQDVVPICCKASHDATEWYCSNYIEDKNYYTSNCNFPINDCTDPLQDCISTPQYCMHMILANEEDQCEQMSNNVCFDAGVSKWMYDAYINFSSAPGADGDQTKYTRTIMVQGTFSNPTSYTTLLEPGSYRVYWSVSTGGTYPNPNFDDSKYMFRLIIRGKYSNQWRDIWSHDVLWGEIYSESSILQYDFTISEPTAMVDFRIYNHAMALIFHFMRFDKLPSNPPTPAPTQSQWEKKGSGFEVISVAADNQYYAVLTTQGIVYFDGDTTKHIYNQDDEEELAFTDVEISADGNTVLARGVNSHIYYLSEEKWVALPIEWNMFDQVSLSGDGSQIYAVNANERDLYYRNGLNILNGSWQSVPGKVHDVEVSGDGNHIWGLQKNRKRNNVLYKNGLGGTWKRIKGPCQFLSLSVTMEGKYIWGVCPTTGGLYHRAGVDGDWQQMMFPTSALKVSVSTEGQHVWVIDSIKEIYYLRVSEYLDIIPE